MLAVIPEPVTDVGVAAAVLTATVGALLLLWKIARGVGRMASIADVVTENFDPNRDGGTLPNQVNRIESDVRRIADGIDTMSAMTQANTQNIERLDHRVTTLEAWKDTQ